MSIEEARSPLPLLTSLQPSYHQSAYLSHCLSVAHSMSERVRRPAFEKDRYLE